MIRGLFFQGGNIRRVVVDGRKVLMMATETNWLPVEIDVDKIKSIDNLNKIKNSEKVKEEFKKLIDDSQKLKTEYDIFKDIKLDFKKTGWRCQIIGGGVNEWLQKP